MNYQKIIFKFSFLAVFLAIFFSFSQTALAVDQYTCVCKNKAQASSKDEAGCVTICKDKGGLSSIKSADSASSKELPNPLKITDLNSAIARIVNFVLSFVGSVSLLMFLYGGITWMTSAGAPDKVKKGRDIIVWSIIGLAVVFSSYVLVRLVIEGLTTK